MKNIIKYILPVLLLAAPRVAKADHRFHTEFRVDFAPRIECRHIYYPPIIVYTQPYPYIYEPPVVYYSYPETRVIYGIERPVIVETRYYYRH